MKGAVVRYVKKFLKVVAFILILESAFVIHEYGHLREFQKRGIPVKEFSLGIGPVLYQHHGNEFTISIRAIPIAAYVAPTKVGEELFETTLSAWDKFVIFSAGVRNNLIVALFLVFLF